MSRNKSKQRRHPASDQPVGHLESPDQLWGRKLGRPIFDAHLPFEERVERAWEHIKATRFMPEEHERLREVLVEMVIREQRGTPPAKEPMP